MKILFIFPHIHPYNSKSVREKPSGGTEKVVCFLSEALTKLGHECRIVTSLEEFPEVDINWPEVVITQESQLFYQFPKAKKIWWLHHIPGQEIVDRGAVWARVYADKIVTLSQYHHDEIKNQLRLDSTVIRHGIWLNELCSSGVDKTPRRFIYASTPFRGLKHLLRLFPAIRSRYPDATLTVCSSMQTYGDTDGDSRYQELFEALEQIEGIRLTGSLNQTELYRELAEAEFFLYPNNWPETECLVLTEAIAHGCKPIVTPVGSLPEKVKKAFTIDEMESDLLDSIEYSEYEPINWLDIATEWEEILPDEG